MKRMLSMEDIQERYDDYATERFEEREDCFIMYRRLSDDKIIVPKYEYEYVGGGTISALSAMADTHHKISALLAIIGSNPSTISYLCLRFDEGNDGRSFIAVDPLDLKDEYTHIKVWIYWSMHHGTTGIDAEKLEHFGGILCYLEDDEYGLGGTAEFVLPINDLVMQGIANDYRIHVTALIEAGDQYVEDLILHRDECKKRIMKQLERLKQVDAPWCVDVMYDDSLVLTRGVSSESVVIRFDVVGCSKIKTLADSYCNES